MLNDDPYFSVSTEPGRKQAVVKLRISRLSKLIGQPELIAEYRSSADNREGDGSSSRCGVRRRQQQHCWSDGWRRKRARRLGCCWRGVFVGFVCDRAAMAVWGLRWRGVECKCVVHACLPFVPHPDVAADTTPALLPSCVLCVCHVRSYASGGSSYQQQQQQQTNGSKQVTLTDEGLPIRPGKKTCPHYVKFGW